MKRFCLALSLYLSSKKTNNKTSFLNKYYKIHKKDPRKAVSQENAETATPKAPELH